MLELAGISGEAPAAALHSLAASRSYAEKVITFLKKEKLLKLHYKDQLRGYRLTAKGKKYLLSLNPARFRFYLTGNSDTNQPRSAPARRLRLHQAAMTYAFLLHTGTCIFRDQKPLIFDPEAAFTGTLTCSAFYHSRELKAIGMEAVKINNSRAMGILLAPQAVFVLYYAGNGTLKWEYKTEVKLRVLLNHHISTGTLAAFYKPDTPVRALFLGSGMNTALQLMTGIHGDKTRYFSLDQSYEYFHYLPDTKVGITLLKVLTNRNLSRRLSCLLSSDLQPPDHRLGIEHDALTKTGIPVLFAYGFDMLHISRFAAGCSLRQILGSLICFDFQKEVLTAFCPETITITAIDLAKFERRFLH